MVEPTESESRFELDRLCDALIAIREEIREIEEGRADREDNALKNAPHTARSVVADAWNRPYSRERAAFPAAWVRERSCREIAAEIQRSLNLLNTTLRDVPARHRSVQAAFDYSWNLLLEERMMLRTF